MCKFVPLHVDIFISFFMVMVFNYFLRLILSNNFSLRKLLQLLTYGIRSFQVRDLKIFEPILWRFRILPDNFIQIEVSRKFKAY